MEYVKKPCKHCPFRNDVTPFLHPDRATQLAYAAQNPYSEFHCHKTIEHDEEDGEGIVTNESKLCAGFLTLRAQAGESLPDGFEPSFDIVYEDEWDMISAYEEQWDNKHHH